MMKLIKNKKGEGYIDVAITIMIVSFVIVFIINIVSLVALNQNLKTIADHIVEYSSQQGTTAIDDYVEELSDKIDFFIKFYIIIATKIRFGNSSFGANVKCTTK